MATTQITILNTNTQVDGSFTVSGVFWLVAPTDNVIQIPTFQSLVTNIDSATLLALQAGTLVEIAFNSGLFPVGTITADVETALMDQYSTAQTALTNNSPQISGLIGLTYDGSSWNTPIVPTFIPSVVIAPQYTKRSYHWTAWKATLSNKVGMVQYDDNGAVYIIWFYDGPEVNMCTIWKGTVPAAIISSGLTQNQNDSDKSDFESNFKPTANAAITLKTADGRDIQKPTVANRMKNFKQRNISFYTAAPNSLHNVSPVTNASYGDVSYTMYSDATTVTTDNTQAIKTILNVDPVFSYEIISGRIYIPSSLKDGSTDQWFLSGIGVPDYPANYGGSIDYISEINLEAITTGTLYADGRAVSYLMYNAGGAPHTNRLQFIIKHPIGAQSRFMICLEWYTL